MDVRGRLLHNPGPLNGTRIAQVSLPLLKLKAREERRIRAGHAWVFSNEVDVEATPMATFEAGEPVNVVDHQGQALGTAYVNPASLICARMVSRRPGRALDGAVVRRRLRAAIELRERMGFEGCYRAVYGESDGLPGLVVYRHRDVLVVQVATEGMQRLQAQVLEALLDLLSPRALLLRNDSSGRRLEGLAEEVHWAYGSPDGEVEIVDNGVRFQIDPQAGQKTGWYYDHRMNRARLASYARDARVLDLFSYLGGFGVQAAVAGAREVVCVDSSRSALEGVLRNARANGVEARVGTERGDVFEVLKNMAAAGERFDVVVADPPAFARRKRDLKAASEAYQRLHRMAMRVMGEQGILLAASCSSHVDRRTFGDCIRRGARGAARQLLELEVGRQGPDHPVHLAMPETDYLKSSLLLVRG